MKELKLRIRCCAHCPYWRTVFDREKSAKAGKHICLLMEGAAIEIFDNIGFGYVYRSSGNGTKRVKTKINKDVARFCPLPDVKNVKKKQLV